MKKHLILPAFLAMMALPTFANAHTPLFSCFDNGDGTVLCQGGFSNGNAAAGIKVVIADASGKEISTAVLDDNSEIIFDKPAGDYTVMMDAGEGHTVTVKSAEITE